MPDTVEPNDDDAIDGEHEPFLVEVESESEPDSDAECEPIADCPIAAQVSLLQAFLPYI